jgi:hypothetical protein
MPNFTAGPRFIEEPAKQEPTIDKETRKDII